MSPEGPPNLRYSDSDKDCLSCRAFKPGSQTCSMFSDWPVAPDLLCDAWEAKVPSGQVRDDDQAA